MSDVIALAEELLAIESFTGRESEVVEFVARWFISRGWNVAVQEVSAGRCNVWASRSSGGVTLSTHVDTVPPHIPPRLEDGQLYGRGACDAKGAAVAEIAAAERLRTSGEARIGLLFVVGEERGSEGAKLANTIATGSRYLINGEPTDNRLATATRGVYRARLRTTGRAAHSSQPELGASAIEKLVDALVSIRGVVWPTDAVLGETYYTVGMIKGGVAPNVIPPDAEAEVMFRTVGDYREVRGLLEDAVRGTAAVDHVLFVPPVSLATVPGLPTAAFNFTTDIPFLDRWGAPLLLGPGSVSLAHTADEYVAIADLRQAADRYVSLARHLLAESPATGPMTAS
jgi:acetylornithine deacetylase